MEQRIHRSEAGRIVWNWIRNVHRFAVIGFDSELFQQGRFGGRTSGKYRLSDSTVFRQDHPVTLEDIRRMTESIFKARNLNVVLVGPHTPQTDARSKSF